MTPKRLNMGFNSSGIGTRSGVLVSDSSALKREIERFLFFFFIEVENEEEDEDEGLFLG